MRRLPIHELEKRLVNSLPKEKRSGVSLGDGMASGKLNNYIHFMRERAGTLKELWKELEIFLVEPSLEGEEIRKALLSPQAETVLQKILDALEKDWTGDSFPVKSLSDCQKQLGVKGSDFYSLFRLSLTGHPHGPELKEFCPLLGKEEVLRRLKRAIHSVQSLK
jgi:glutamyl/glutaminyl-tRNA synthetase